jgi:hypothetical protein
VAVVENERFYLFDLNPTGDAYVFVQEAPVEFPIPIGIRAAFPLSFYQNKMGCVVSGEVFDSPEGYATIFHEFIHCLQWETCEMKLKNQLRIAGKAASEENYMWELDHPFPYDDSMFVEIYTTFLAAAADKDAATVRRCRMVLKEESNLMDYEYLLWVEWKEGMARRLENIIKRKFQWEENQNGSEPPFNRATFYAGGEKYMDLLIGEDKDLDQDMEALFERMRKVE